MGYPRKISGAVERAAYTINEFCDAHRISRAHYYNLKRLGQSPDEARAGDRTVIITMEAAARWRRQREKAARALENAERAPSG